MIAINEARVREGLPHPRGATWQGKGVNCALFSAHATRVELCLFDETGERETARIDLPEYTDEPSSTPKCRSNGAGPIKVFPMK